MAPSLDPELLTQGMWSGIAVRWSQWRRVCLRRKPLRKLGSSGHTGEPEICRKASCRNRPKWYQKQDSNMRKEKEPVCNAKGQEELAAGARRSSPGQRTRLGRSFGPRCPRLLRSRLRARVIETTRKASTYSLI